MGVETNASALDIKKAYKRLAFIHHPGIAPFTCVRSGKTNPVDKNPGDETAHAKFQAIGEAYQVLYNEDRRRAYDKYGKDQARPSEGFTDPAEFFGTIFGGDAFVDLIGEISLMKDLTRTMDITMQEGDEEEEFPGTEAAKRESLAAEKAGSAARATSPVTVTSVVETTEPPASSTAHDRAATSPTPTASGTSTPRYGIPIRQAIMSKSDAEAQLDATGLTEEESELRKKEKKKGGLSKEQREKLAAYEEERSRIRKERVDTLAKKLVDRISIWTETDKDRPVTLAFQEKTRLEVENLKMESFGLDILHAIGQTYISKASALLKSQKYLGIGGLFSRLKDKGTLAKDTWNTISSAIDAQVTMEEMAKLEEKGGDEWTDERRVEYERRVTGKILTAAWRGSKFEIQGVLRDVCDKILNDKKVPVSKRLERAHALIISGEVYSKVLPP
jgi:curved DNA-binding protein CbpA